MTRRTERDGGRGTVENGKGRFVQRYENARVAVEGTVDDGRKAGVWRDWYRSGRLRRKHEYAEGRIEAAYVDGLLEGEVRT